MQEKIKKKNKEKKGGALCFYKKKTKTCQKGVSEKKQGIEKGQEKIKEL